MCESTVMTEVSDESEVAKEVRVTYTNAMLCQGCSRVQGHLFHRVVSPSVEAGFVGSLCLSFI